MSKTETLRQSAAAKNEQRIEHLASQIQAVRTAKIQSAEDLATVLEPLAQAMAALTDETRQTLAEIDRRGRALDEKAGKQMRDAARTWTEAAERVQKSADSLDKAGRRIEWSHYLLSVMVAAITAVVVSGLWVLLAPAPVVRQTLDAQAVAELLKPAVTEALKPSKGR